MNAEWLLVARHLKLEAVGGADAVIIDFPSGAPYRHLIVWAEAIVAPGDVTDVDIQPIFAGIDEGTVITLTTAGLANRFQAAVDEIRPPSRGINKHPKDEAVPREPLFQVEVSNDAVNAVAVNVFIMAAASPGGA